MKYMGSKSRFANEIVKTIISNTDIAEFENYVEPFVGAASVIEKIANLNHFQCLVGNDLNHHLISMFQSLQDGWLPPIDVSEEEYIRIKNNRNNPCMSKEESALTSFVGFGCSYAAKYFGGYARGKSSRGQPRNYAQESYNSLLKQRDKIKNIQFCSMDYRELDIPNKSIIYCDPPYQNTTKYKDTFDSVRFWEWCELQNDNGNKIIVSEYSAPAGWVSVWEREVHSSLTKDTGSKKAKENIYAKLLLPNESSFE
jgi:DNA adenine methylase